MRKQAQIDELKRENLRLNDKVKMLCSVMREYEEKNGNAYTYMRKMQNILKYYDEDKEKEEQTNLLDKLRDLFIKETSNGRFI